jgi:hypothetical protein
MATSAQHHDLSQQIAVVRARQQAGCLVQLGTGGWPPSRRHRGMRQPDMNLGAAARRGRVSTQPVRQRGADGHRLLYPPGQREGLHHRCLRLVAVSCIAEEAGGAGQRLHCGGQRTAAERFAARCGQQDARPFRVAGLHREVGADVAVLSGQAWMGVFQRGQRAGGKRRAPRRENRRCRGLPGQGVPEVEFSVVNAEQGLLHTPF